MFFVLNPHADVLSDARPGFATYGQQELPTYDLTVAISVKRN